MFGKHFVYMNGTDPPPTADEPKSKHSICSRVQGSQPPPFPPGLPPGGQGSGIGLPLSPSWVAPWIPGGLPSLAGVVQPCLCTPKAGNLEKHLPYHGVDCRVEGLSLLPEYTEDKAVEAGPDEANNGPTQPDEAVRVSLDLWVVKVAGA